MLQEQLADLITSKLGHSPTTSQENLIQGVSKFLIESTGDGIFLMKGYAGTGKTTLLAATILAMEGFKMKTILLAPTGRAAKVLSNATHRNAFTIHKQIYRQKSSKDGFGSFNLDVNLCKDTVFIIDEASMISNRSNEENIFGSGKLLDDLITYIRGGIRCRLIICGDTAQLPPVGIDISPALDKKVLEFKGYSVWEFELTDVVRQGEASGILKNATILRDLVLKKKAGYPKLQCTNFPDIIRLSGADLEQSLNDEYDRHGFEQVIITCRTNKRANIYNQGIRSKILWREDVLCVGDMLMVVKNNYFWMQQAEEFGFIANGDTAEVMHIKKYHERYGYHFAEVSLRMIDYDIYLDALVMTDILNLESAALGQEEQKKLFYTINEDFMDIQGKKNQYEKIKQDPYYNALQVKFAYAVTCHKAQGGQWHTAFIDQGYLTGKMVNSEYLRWLYTAITRATSKVYLVNFNEDFF